MSKRIVNALKAQTKKLEYSDLRVNKEVSENDWKSAVSGNTAYIDLKREHDLTINNQKVANKFINELYSKHENLISKDENGRGNYRPFAREILIEMFKNAGSTVPNDLIIEELITNYNQGGYVGFFFWSYFSILDLERMGLNLSLNFNGERAFRIDCDDPNCLKFSFGMESIPVNNIENHSHKVCDLSGLVEFKLKCKDGNVTYEDGKILLTIPKELENYKAGDDKFLDKLTDIVNKIIEYLKKLCEKLGFKFDTRVEYDSERNIKMEHNLGKPLKVIDKPDLSTLGGLKLKVSNS